MFDDFIDFLWDHTWARRLVLVAAAIIGLCGDVVTFYVTFTCGDPLVIVAIWINRLVGLKYELQVGDTVFEVFEFVKKVW